MESIRTAITKLRLREDGFSLMEATAAMAVAIIMFVVLAQSLSVTIRIGQENRAQQNATSVGIEALEFARSLDFAELNMNDDPDAADSNVYLGTWVNPDDGLTYNNVAFLDGDQFGLTNDERLMIDATDGRIEPESDETLDGQTYTAHTYVTEIDSGLKRVVVEVTYDFNGRERVHQTSTVVTELRG